MKRISLRALWCRFRAAPRARIISYAVLISVLCGVTGFLEPLDDFARNIRYSLRYVQADGSIVVVGIDQKSASKLGGKYPWPRRVDAQLIENLKAAGVGKIVFDLSFVDVDTPANNAALNKALDRYRGDVYFGSGVLDAHRGIISSSMFPAAVYRPHVEIGTFKVWTNPIGQLAKLYIENRQHVDSGQPEARFPGLSVILSRKQQPTTATFRPDYAIRSSTFPTYSFSDVVLKKIGPDQLAGRDVIIGFGEMAFGDSHFAPGQGRIQGVYAHAIGAQTLKSGTPVDFGWVFPTLAAAVAALALLGTRRIASTGTVAVATIGALGLVPLIFDGQLVSIDIAPATLLFGIALVQHARLTFGWRKSRTHEPSGLPNVVALREVTSGLAHNLIAARIDNHAAITASFAKDVEPLIASEIVGRLKVGDASINVYQGDEGVYYLLSPITDIVLLSEHLDGLHALFSQPIRVGDRQIDVAITFGVDNNPERAMSSRIGSALLSAEDARSQGRRWKLYDEARNADASWQLSLGGEIDRGLAAGEFWLAYQPKLDLKSNTIVGAEVLVRWAHPVRGAIGPGEFIPAAERDHRIERLTRFVFEQAMRDATRLASTTRLSLALNVSVPVLRQPRFASYVIDLVAQNGLLPQRFTIEITESVFLSVDDDVVVDNLKRLGTAGFGISIDDFGTGFSTLESLQRVPATEVKIDQTFVKTLVDRTADRVIVESIIKMAQGLNRTVVAEGVEDAATLNELKALGCDQAQGFLIGRPQVFSEFVQLASARLAQNAA